MHCKKCGGDLAWNADFTWLVCDRCRHKHDPIEIRDRQWKDESDFREEEMKQKKRKRGRKMVLDLGAKFRR